MRIPMRLPLRRTGRTRSFERRHLQTAGVALVALVLATGPIAAQPPAAQDAGPRQEATLEASAPDTPADEDGAKTSAPDTPGTPGTLGDASKGDASKPGKTASRPATVATICGLIAGNAEAVGMSKAFFARLIWKESRFDAAALSPVGAQGIAQFMPYTAAERGLSDPYDIAEAIRHSALYLRDLKAELGNWGLAAAAYNGGPNRVKALDGERRLPARRDRAIRQRHHLPPGGLVPATTATNSRRSRSTTSSTSRTAARSFRS